jgi:hypothetical protein
MTMASMLALGRSPPVLSTNSIMDVAKTFQNWDDLERPAKREVEPSNSTSESPFASTMVRSKGVARMTAAYSLAWTSLAILVLSLVSGVFDGLIKLIIATIAGGRNVLVE